MNQNEQYLEKKRQLGLSLKEDHDNFFKSAFKQNATIIIVGGLLSLGLTVGFIALVVYIIKAIWTS